MSIPQVMFEAVKAFEPREENTSEAIEAAFAAGEKYTRDVGDIFGGPDSEPFNPQKLREAASEIWSLYMGVMHSKLLPWEIRESLPPLYAQENESDPVVYVKFFTPDSFWTWFATEFDGLNTFFGLCVGHEEELGYFLLSELESARGPLGASIERDLHFTPKRLSEAKVELALITGIEDAPLPRLLIVLIDPEPDQDNDEDQQAL